MDGSIEVIAAAQPGFASIIRSGTNVVLSGTNGTPGANYAVLTATNVALPLSNWVSIVTNQFGGGGGFSFTNAIAPRNSAALLPASHTVTPGDVPGISDTASKPEAPTSGDSFIAHK